MHKKKLIAAVTLVLGMATFFVGCEADAFHENTSDSDAGLIDDVDVKTPDVDMPDNSSSSGSNYSSTSNTATGYCDFGNGSCVSGYTKTACNNADGEFVTSASLCSEKSSSSSSSTNVSGYEYCEYTVVGYSFCNLVTASSCVSDYSGTVVSACP